MPENSWYFRFKFAFCPHRSHSSSTSLFNGIAKSGWAIEKWGKFIPPVFSSSVRIFFPSVASFSFFLTFLLVLQQPTLVSRDIRRWTGQLTSVIQIVHNDGRWWSSSFREEWCLGDKTMSQYGLNNNGDNARFRTWFVTDSKLLLISILLCL